MIHHVTLGVSDLERARAFYLAALQPLGGRIVREFERGVGFMVGEMPVFWISRGGPTRPPVHVAFGAEDRDSVRAFHEAALAAGGTDNGAPGLRPQYHRNYYGASVLDPDGHNVEAVCRHPEQSLRPRQVVDVWVEAFNRADPDALSGFYHETAVNHQVALEPVEGRDSIRAMFAREFAAAKMVCIPEQVLEDGEWAILEWRDPQGLRGCCFFQVVDGKITLQRGYWDKLSFDRPHGARSIDRVSGRVRIAGAPSAPPASDERSARQRRARQSAPKVPRVG